MKALGIIFSNLHDDYIAQLTRKRTLASVPFGGRYRLVDFALSDMANSGITHVGVITKNNYQPLMDHIGSGKAWDLSRKNGGVTILPPYGAAESSQLYKNRLEALIGVTGFIRAATEEYVVMSDCDNICVVDYEDIMEKHAAANADITVVTARTEPTGDPEKTRIAFDADESGRVTRVHIGERLTGLRQMHLNMTCISRQFLLHLLEDSAAQGYKSFSRDILAGNTENYKIFVYEHDGYFACIDSLADYYKHSMELLDKDKREALFHKKGFPIYTKARDSAPVRYGKNSRVSHSLIADGCIVEGTVENSILFRGVRTGEGSVIRDSIVMQDTIVSRNAALSCVIADRNVFIREKRVLSGCDVLPYYVAKSTIL
jgi:glucose-1-phosphate adenylyltransferase